MNEKHIIATPTAERVPRAVALGEPADGLAIAALVVEVSATAVDP
jgi:hypothetical protein